MKADLKKSKDNFRSPFGYKSIKELGQGKVFQAKTVSREAKVGARGTRALAKRTYFPTCPKAKFYSSCHGAAGGEGGDGETKEESNESMGIEGPWSKDKTTASTCT